MGGDMDVALASCLVLPEPDPDAAPLAAALAAAGIEARVLGWDDAGADFGSARLTILRSTWNYPLAPDAFAAWIERTARVSELWNPAAALLWNLHKRYLLALADAGVTTVPTRLVRRGDATPLAEALRALGAGDDAVVKPAISAASFRTLRVRGASELARGPSELARGEAHLRALVADGDALVQPYLGSVEDRGERALVWIDGELTHAVRKAPRFSGDAESVSAAVPIAADEAELARRALAAAPGPLLYARVDVARDDRDRPVVMELELMEPSLFFDQCPAALERYVRAVARRLGRG
jgi:hypothetical protein